jgi:hypothetical protein
VTAQRCRRAWQAEAWLDRRISAEDRASFSRHARTCAECERTLLELMRLQELGNQLPWPKVEPLQRKRQRNELLRRAHTVGLAAPMARWRYGALLAACCALLLIFGYRRLVQPRPNASEPALTYQVHPDAGSVWRRLQGGHAVRLQLDSGRLTVQVDKLQARQSFVLRLPDGELEVRGTRFVVDAADGGTRAISVSEGLVALRVRGRPELLLGVGASWQAEPTPAAAIPPRPLDSASPQQLAPVVNRPGITSARPTGSVAPTPAPTPGLSAGVTAPNNDFASAMAAFDRGDFGTAEQSFERFERAHPQSSQVEDALFLRAMTRESQASHSSAGARLPRS